MKRLAIVFMLFFALPASAEVTLSFYTGAQTAPHSRVRGNDGTSDFNFLAEWEGRSGEAPPYYGFRATWWKTDRLGFGAEFNHAKVYASDETLADNGLETLEFTDGINILTANVFYRWPNQWAKGKLTPYTGAGIGVAIPHVEFDNGGEETFGYQVTGPAATLIAGLSYDLNETWALFGEYKMTYSSNKADLDGGGTLETDIITNAINIGISYNF
ncbi:porin family protein [Alphaproteobacteria bacterium KMM 3653]|uniref:Porin family protein n=1 Tax=Harenicola maris TaxID=2841044 RepID=A0AAP2G7R4_9RHOB|nr:porin family protein [Harenicola maris]